MSPPSGIQQATPVLFMERGCAFAHRVLALVAHLGVPLELRTSLVGERPPGLEEHSRCGLVPLLVHGSLVLTDSRTMLEHLAEHHQMPGALPDALDDRTAHRHAMAVVDGFLAPRLRGPVATGDRAPLEGVLDALERAASVVEPSLLAFHVAPLWLRFRWWHPSGTVVRAVERRPALVDWLDGVAELDAVTATTPSALARHDLDSAVLALLDEGLLDVG